MRTLLNLGATCYRWTHQPANVPAVRRIAAASATIFGIVFVLACGAPLPTGDPGASDGPIAPGGAVGVAGWPVPPGTPITRGYGCSSFYTGVHGVCGTGWWHDGVDWAAHTGTPEFAVRDLVIQFAGVDTSPMDCSWIAGSQPPHTGFGNYIRAADGAGLVYWYGHVSSFNVATGQQVRAGQQIAGMGSTGCSTGDHLHLRVRQNGLDINPLTILRQP